MSTVCVLTPIVVGSWPMIANAVAGAAASMGFSVLSSNVATPEGVSDATLHERVVVDVPNSDVVKEAMDGGQAMVSARDGVTLRFGIDERGRCTVCASGKGLSKRRLTEIAEAVSGRVVQQFAYHKLMAELKQRRFTVVQEHVAGDESIQLRVVIDR